MLLMTTPNRPTTFRLDPDVRARLDVAAREDARSANAELNVALREWLDARDSKRKEK